MRCFDVLSVAPFFETETLLTRGLEYGEKPFALDLALNVLLRKSLEK